MVERLNGFRPSFVLSLSGMLTPSRQTETVAHTVAINAPVSQRTLRNIEASKVAIRNDLSTYEQKVSHVDVKDAPPRLREELTAICTLLNDAAAGSAVRQKAFRVLQRVFHPEALKETKHSSFRREPGAKPLPHKLVRMVHDQLCQPESFYRFDRATRDDCLKMLNQMRNEQTGGNLDEWLMLPPLDLSNTATAQQVTHNAIKTSVDALSDKSVSSPEKIHSTLNLRIVELAKLIGNSGSSPDNRTESFKLLEKIIYDGIPQAPKGFTRLSPKTIAQAIEILRESVKDIPELQETVASSRFEAAYLYHKIKTSVDALSDKSVSSPEKIHSSLNLRIVELAKLIGNSGLSLDNRTESFKLLEKIICDGMPQARQGFTRLSPKTITQAIDILRESVKDIPELQETVASSRFEAVYLYNNILFKRECMYCLLDQPERQFHQAIERNAMKLAGLMEDKSLHGNEYDARLNLLDHLVRKGLPKARDPNYQNLSALPATIIRGMLREL